MEVKVSVVVPVYNVQLYLDQCVQSILNQTLREIEIIFVDDGSTDNSLAILEKYQQIDSRIKIIKQKNQFAGVARNNGMREAKGKYIIFLDSDDFFEKEMLKTAFDYAEKYNVPIVIFGNWEYDNQTKKDKKKEFVFKKTIVKSREDLGINLFNYTSPVPWNKLINLQFIKKNNLLYKSIRKNEDEHFNRIIVAFADRICFVHKRFVHYRCNNEKSLQGNRQIDVETLKCGLLAIKYLKSDLESSGLFKGDVKNAYIRLAFYHITTRMNIALSDLKVLRELFNSVKNELVPLFFLSEDEFCCNNMIEDIFQSESVDIFLCKQSKNYSENYFPIQSQEYKIGSFICKILRAFRSFV